MSRSKAVKSISVMLLGFMLFLVPALQAQSIHQIEYLAHQSDPKQPSYFSNQALAITPIREGKNSSLSHAVFGFLPDWEYSEARNNLQYELLSHIACFDFTASGNGSISNPSYWPWTDVINTAHSHGVKMIMTLVDFNTAQIHEFLTNQSLRMSLFENIRQKLDQYDLQGVNVDFENVATTDRGSLLNAFMAELSDYLHTEIPGSEVSFAGPPVNWGGWNLVGLAQSCDYIFIMGYNYYGSWSETTGPSAPLRGGSINITQSLENDYGALISSAPGKLILGLPYYGDRWQTRTSSAYSSTIDHLGHPRYKTAFEEAQTHGLRWDFRAQASWYYYRENSQHYQVWFETDSSLSLKYDLVLKHDLMGTGMWALGYDGDRTELWEALRSKFTHSTGTEIQNNLPDKVFSLFPNPTANILHIRLNEDLRRDISGQTLNTLGQLVRTFKLSQPLTRIALEGLPDGLYFIRIADQTERVLKQ